MIVTSGGAQPKDIEEWLPIYTANSKPLWKILQRFCIGRSREHAAENEVKKTKIPPLVPPPEELERFHSCPYLSWDYNWDRRANVRKDKAGQWTVAEQKNLIKLRRRVILVNDCHHVNDTGEDAPSLTALGVIQARDLAHFLADWITWEEWLPSTVIFHSPLTRSQELAKIIGKEMANVPVKELELLAEGIPTPRSPRPMDSSASTSIDIHENYPRLEAGFRALFYRPDPNQKGESIQIVLAHSNVIRYFICRALQLPPEAYTRFHLNHGSVSRIEIFGDGNVQVVSVGDTGYQTPDKFTIGEIDAVPPVL